jgi:hypothetical protein
MRKTTFALFAATLASAAAQSTISPDARFAWGANLGWINFRPDTAPAEGVRVGDFFLSGKAWAGNVGWIDFGDGTPLNGVRYSNTDHVDFGVNHDGAGNLRGLAWAPNIGWINFGWSDASDPSRPRIDLASGNFSGLAWSPNCGWIQLGSGSLRTETIVRTDSDADGISDQWERQHAGSLTVLSAFGDADGDGVSDSAEYVADTNPLQSGDALRLHRVVALAGGKSSELTWTSRPTRFYRVHEKSEFGAGSWQANAIGNVRGSAGEFTTQVILHPASATRYFCIEALLPPLVQP